MISWVLLRLVRFKQHKQQCGISEHGRLPHGLAQSHASKFKTDARLPSFLLLLLIRIYSELLQEENVNICKFTRGLVYSPRLLNWPEGQHDL